ncbi:recombinase RecD [Synergistales bacterium]|nr:recombinase RecD [Synergistales bacterium]
MTKTKYPAIPDNTAAIYARYSSHNQREESIDAQIRACRAYAEHKGLQIVEIYTDSAKSGTNADREEFQRMLKESGEKRFKNLVIHKFDRFSRDKYDTVTAKRKLKINGVTILSVTENLDSSPESVILESCLEGMSAYYSLNLAREVMKGMRESAYQCTHLGGTPPLGYDVDPATRKYVINEHEAKIVRTIFEKYADGVGYNQILSYLNGLGYRTKQGNPFRKNSLGSIIDNEKYIGKYIFNKKLEKDVSGKRNPQVKPESEWIVVEDGLPAIIDKDTFNKAQAKKDRNSRDGGRHKAKEIYLLSGLVFCGECGAGMYGNTRICGRGKTRYSSYRCSSRQNHQGCSNKEIRREYLESYVLDELYNKLFSDGSIKKLAGLLSEYNRRKADDSDEELSLARKELDEINRKIDSVVRLVSDSGVSIETVKGNLRELEERKFFVDGRIRELSLQNNVAIITEEQIIELISRSKDFVRAKNISECRNFIEAYVEKVIVYGDKVEVRFKIHVPTGDTKDTVSPLTSKEQIKSLHKEYRDAV